MKKQENEQFIPLFSDYFKHDSKFKSSLPNEANRFNREGISYCELGNYISSLNSFHHAFEVLRSAEDRGEIAVVLNNIGYVNIALGNYKEASDYFTEATHVSYKKAPLTEATSLANLASLKKIQGDLNGSLDLYDQALKLFSTVGPGIVISVTLNNIASTFQDLKDYKMAIDYYKRSLKLISDLGNEYIRSSILNNLGKLHISLKNYDEAYEYLLASLSIKLKLGDVQRISNVYSNLSEVQFKRNQIENAVEYLISSISLQKDQNDIYGLSQNYKFLGELNVISGQKQNAIKYFEHASLLLKKLKLKTELNDLEILRNKLLITPIQ